MKQTIFTIMMMASVLGFSGCAGNDDPATWSSEKIDTWFEKGEWLNGWQVKPDESINRKAFAVSYFRNRERWDKTFLFLRNNDLPNLEIKRYEIDGDNAYAPVSEYLSKNEEDAKFEAHRKYIDLQYVVSGKEIMGIAPASEKKDIITPYDEIKDVEFMTVGNLKNYPADPGRFFILFPEDLHRPGLKDGENAPVRKLVVKIKVD